MVLVRRTLIFLLIFANCALCASAADELATIRSQMDRGQWSEAAHGWSRWLETYPEDVNGWYQRGVCALRLDDFITAGTWFEEAIRRDPAYNDKAAISFADAGRRALDAGANDRATALFAKAVYHDKDLAPELGRALLKAADLETDEAKRTRLVGRLAQWTSPAEVLEAARLWYERQWGPPRRVYLQTPGWAELVKVKAGDRMRYLALRPFRQRTATVARILPEAVNTPLAITFSVEDVGKAGEAMLVLGRHAEPVEAFVWIVPGPNADM